MTVPMRGTVRGCHATWKAIASVAVVAALSLPAGAAMATEVRTGEPITPVQPVPGLDAREVALGALLFRDPRLSGDGLVSCASCHDVASNGAGDQPLSVQLGRTPPSFNTPTVFNAVHNFRFNWEGRFDTLEAQVLASLQNPQVMQADIDIVLQRLRDDPAMALRFRRIYARQVNRANLLSAITSYERSLTTPGAPFDRWLGGDDSALDARQLRGYQTFKAIGCVSCHQGGNVGGNLFQRSGVFEPAARKSVERLRVPSLRNVAVTAPYFHDGSAATLPAAIRAMGRAQLGVTLQPGETADIMAFLQALTGPGQRAPARSEPTRPRAVAP